MPTRLSKFTVDAKCKDYVHPWVDSCVSATTGLGLHTLQESLRIYSSVYIIALVMKGKVPSVSDLQKTAISILQSTAFLSWSGFTYAITICTIRRILGNFNIFTVSFIPSFISSFSSILLEKPSRRTMLSLYVSNIATETLFRMAVMRGYAFPIPHGEIYIFAASMATLLYFYRSKKDTSDSIYKVLRIGIGQYEESKFLLKDIKPKIEPKEESKKRQKVTKMSQFSLIWNSLRAYKQIIEKLKGQRKSLTCPHPYSCVHYVLMGGVKLFGYGIGVQLGLKLFLQFKQWIRNPRLVKGIVFNKENWNLALFLGGFSGLFRLVSCSLRRIRGQDSPYHAIPAALLASVAFASYADNTIALYVMWKALQFLWNTGVENGQLPEIKWFVLLLYCFSTAVLFHAAIIEPQNLRSSYFKFLYTISGGRIAVMSRRPLDDFGLKTSESLQAVLQKTRTTDAITYSF